MGLGVSKNDVTKYYQRFYEILERTSEKLNFDSILVEFSVAKETLKKKLKEYLRYYPEHIEKVVGFYPSVDTIIDQAEKTVGALNGSNLFDVNMACKKIVDSITLPMHEEFVRSELDSRGLLDDGQVVGKFDEVFEFIYEDYSDFLVGSGNGVVSIAGRMNEEILMRAMEAEGLQRDVDFKRSGTNSEADIIIANRLFCEVKSYKARERFLRGLKDIPHREKIGVGFFLDASEFNPTRTTTLLEANPKAIYLPDITYDALHGDSKARKTYEDNFLYRPLSRFVEDMKAYSQGSGLPAFR